MIPGIKPITRSLAAGAAAVLATLAVAGTTSAHINSDAEEVVAGSSELIEFEVPHGCDGSPTTAVRIQMPESIPAVTPTVNANWEAEKVAVALDEPIEGDHGAQLTERVSEVVYTARTPLPDGFRDVFVLKMPIPEDAVGEMIWFPTIQTCAEGEIAWIEIPADGQGADELESPAPGVLVVEG